jgi:NAD(P)-dependent dehydrogenase (short-subunit alcohol dehydrogenase family)
MPAFAGMTEKWIMSLFDLTGKVAIITGSSRGIGRAIAEALADQGAKVVISSRKAEACREVADAINAKHPDAAIVVPASISSKEALQNLVDETRRQLGRIDILVCNAASNPYYGPMGGISDDQFRKILENNVIANHWLIQMVAPEMIEREAGSIIIVSSIGGLKASAVIGAYNISKAADFQLARNLAAEFGPHQVRVNCIAPGLVRTDFAKALWENPDTLRPSPPIRRCSASVSRTRSPAPPSSSPARHRPSSPARPSSSTAARPPASVYRCAQRRRGAERSRRVKRPCLFAQRLQHAPSADTAPEFRRASLRLCASARTS